MDMDTIHLVMLRYTIDCSPLEDGAEQAELVRYAFADYASAELTANQMEAVRRSFISPINKLINKLTANQMEADNLRPDTEYFVRSHSIVPALVVPKQQASE